MAHLRKEDGITPCLGSRSCQVPAAHSCTYAGAQAEVPVATEEQEDKKVQLYSLLSRLDAVNACCECLSLLAALSFQCSAALLLFGVRTFFLVLSDSLQVASGPFAALYTTESVSFLVFIDPQLLESETCSPLCSLNSTNHLNSDHPKHSALGSRGSKGGIKLGGLNDPYCRFSCIGAYFLHPTYLHPTF